MASPKKTLLVCHVVPSNEYSNGAVPNGGCTTDMLPEFPPLHKTSFLLTVVVNGGPGEIENGMVAVHPEASFTTTT